MNFIQVVLEHPKAQIPIKVSKGSSGFDLFSCEDVYLHPGETKLISTGIKLHIPLGYEVQIRSRSGLVLKKGISVLNSPGTIDSDYRGIIGIILHNSNSPNQLGGNYHIEVGSRIAQMVFQIVPAVKLVIVDSLAETERDDGGFGSSGEKEITVKEETK